MDNRSIEAPVADRLAIRELVDRYHAAINYRDWDLLATLFTTDAVWEAAAPIDLRFEGHAEVIKGLQWSVGRQELLVQSSSGLLIDIPAPERALVRSTLIELGKAKDTGNRWQAVAFYTDDVVKDSGVWRFKRRSLQLQYQGDM